MDRRPATRCPGPCARMSRQMAELQSHLGADPRVRLISLTTDPDYDQPEVLRRYAEKFGAQPTRWWFLTGLKQEIGRLAVEGLKLTAREKNPEERASDADLFIHSTVFALVDKHGRLRAVFETQPVQGVEGDAPVDAEQPWAESRSKILAAVRSLLEED